MLCEAEFFHIAFFTSSLCKILIIRRWTLQFIFFNLNALRTWCARFLIFQFKNCNILISRFFFKFQSVEYNSIEEKQTKENKNSSAGNSPFDFMSFLKKRFHMNILISQDFFSDPCLNYCYHGSCYLTSFGVPICNCNFNFSGVYCFEYFP